MIQQLFCLGFGYSAAAYIEAFGGRFDRIRGTVRSEAKQEMLTQTGIGGRAVDSLLFDGQSSSALTHAMGDSACLLVSAPPAETAEQALAAFNASGQTSPLPVVYLSSLGVYGDHGGAEIDESAVLVPTSERGGERIAAEEAWIKFGQQTGSPVTILRLAGIYGPGRNALVSVAKGQARRIVKPGQVFNRVHVADIAQMIDAAFVRNASGIYNGSDDEPTPPQDVIAYAARLLGQTPPPEIPFDIAKAGMSPMAQSFYAECKRALNGKVKSELGITLLYPNYRAGLDALFAERDHERA